MTPEVIAEINATESAEAEQEIRRRHQPRLHGGNPCPTGRCCTCSPNRGGCDAGYLLVMLDRERADAEVDAFTIDRLKGESIYEE